VAILRLRRGVNDQYTQQPKCRRAPHAEQVCLSAGACPFPAPKHAPTVPNQRHIGQLNVERSGCAP